MNNSIGPVILLAVAFAFTLAVRVAILILLRSGETTRTPNTKGPKPTVIPSDLFENKEHAKTPTRTRS